MRESKRDVALEAAKRIVQREGVTALTYESVAAESGLTKGGLIYHFPSREALLHALHQHVADQWEDCMISYAGATAEQCDEATRFEAYAKASQNPDRAELLLMLEAAEDPATDAIWDGVYQRWAPAAPSREPGAEQTRKFLARLAADGLWFYEALCTDELDPAVRSQLVQEIIALYRR